MKMAETPGMSLKIERWQVPGEENFEYYDRGEHSSLAKLHTSVA